MKPILAVAAVLTVAFLIGSACALISADASDRWPPWGPNECQKCINGCRAAGNPPQDCPHICRQVCQ